MELQGIKQKVPRKIVKRYIKLSELHSNLPRARALLNNRDIYLHEGKFILPAFFNGRMDEVKRYTNGCGTSGWKGTIVPETMYGLVISKACDYHDCGFSFGKISFESFLYYNYSFLVNLLLIIDEETTKSMIVGDVLRHLRSFRAVSYFLAVMSPIGWSAFLDAADAMDTRNQEITRELRFSYMPKMTQFLKYANQYTSPFDVLQAVNSLYKGDDFLDRYSTAPSNSLIIPELN